MCNWHWSISIPDESGKMTHLANVRYGGGVSSDAASKEKALDKALRQVTGFTNSKRHLRPSVVITNYSCNGAFESVMPFLEEGAVVEPAHDWDESDWYSFDDEKQEKEYLLWSAKENNFLPSLLTRAEALEKASEEEGDKAAFRKLVREGREPIYLCAKDTTDGLYWKQKRLPLKEVFPSLSWTRKSGEGNE